jgi:response regulator RpfG family c-di-GMP phosphodiesterase
VRVVEDLAHLFLQDTIEAFKRILDNQTKTRVIEHGGHRPRGQGRRASSDLPEKDVSVVQYVASVHDIGMTRSATKSWTRRSTSPTTRCAPSSAIPERGAELIRPLEFVEAGEQHHLYHHERWDGRGYPMGLKGDEIPIGGRILAVIDAFQSMTVGRPYKQRMSTERAVQELFDCAGTQFDRDVVEAFATVLVENGQLAIATRIFTDAS